MRAYRGRCWAFLLLVSVLGACSEPRPEVRAALTGSLPQLKQAIAHAEPPPLDKQRLLELARAVAEREIAGAAGADGSDELLLFRPCVSDVKTPLAERAERADEVAATAKLLLFEAGKTSGAEFTAYRDADSGAFRALAARAAVSAEMAGLRRSYFTDPDERVRRNAFEAAFQAPVAAQLSDLIEAARLDPSPNNRARATRAVGRIGGEAPVLGLSDLFASGDQQQKLAVLDAWSQPPSFRHGGERELARALQGAGLVPVSAATLLLRSKESRAAAIAVLARAIESGSDDEKRVALGSAPLQDASIREALKKAATNPSPQLTPLVLARLTELPGEATKARTALERLSRDESDYGLEANYTLLRFGSASALRRIERELDHERPSRRLRAAVTLAGLGKTERLAPRLGDSDPFVRASISCELLEAR